MAEEIETQPVAPAELSAAPQPQAPVSAPEPPTVVTLAPSLDETIPGGAYIVSGQLVDSEGRPVKKGKR